MKNRKRWTLVSALVLAMLIIGPVTLVHAGETAVPEAGETADSGLETSADEADSGTESYEEKNTVPDSSTQTSDSVAEVKVNGSITYVDKLQEAFKLQNSEAAEIRLLADVNLKDTEVPIQLDSGQTYVLDLNGKSICVEPSASYDLFELRQTALSVQDSGTNGCISNGISVYEGGKFKFSSGIIRSRIQIAGGEAEVTGSACVLNHNDGGHGIEVLKGKLNLSGEVQVYGLVRGLLIGGTTGPYEAVISGQPDVSGGLIGLEIGFLDGLRSFSVCGGTFSGERSVNIFRDEQYAGQKIVLSDLLLNYGTDKTPKYAFFDSNGPVQGANDKYRIIDTVTVRECSHLGSEVEHIGGPTNHFRKCTACGYEGWEDCSYEWIRGENEYKGFCCGDLRLTVMLQPATDCIYNGKEHRPQISVMADETLLEPDDYAVTYENNRNAGTAKLKAEGQNGWQFTFDAKFTIAPALLSVTGAAAVDRAYDGTDKVKVSSVSLAGIIGGDDAAVATDGLSGIIAGTSAGSYDTVTLPENMALTGADAGNYILPESAQTVTTSVTIHKAKASAKNGILKVTAGQAHVYQFALEQLCPVLLQGQEMGSSPAIYVLGGISLGKSCYAGGARIDGAYLILPLLADRNGVEGEIGTVKITIQTENFEDMDALVTVNAIVGSSVNSSTDGSSSSGWRSSIWLTASGCAKPFLKASPSRTGWPTIRQEVEIAAEGSTVAVDMNGNTTVPDSLFAVLQGHDVTVTLDMGRGFVWSVNGRDIADKISGDTDFSVQTVSGSVPAETADAVAEGLAHAELFLAQKGAFGLQSVLSMQTRKIRWTGGSAGNGIGNSTATGYDGMYANLFYYDLEEKKLEFANAGKIAADGSVQLAFTRGSVYIVILSQQPMGSSGQLQKPDSDASDGCAVQDSTDTMEAGPHAKVKSVKLSKTVFTYNGKAKKPSIIAIDTEGRRITAKYYNVTYKNNKKAGIATVSVTFKGIYSSKGTVKRNFTIRPAAASVKKAAALPGAFSVKWEKDLQADGYQIQYSTNAGFKGNSTHSAFVKSPFLTQKTVRKLKPAKNYYVRIRTYKIVKTGGGCRTIYSAWSSLFCLEYQAIQNRVRFD